MANVRYTPPAWRGHLEVLLLSLVALVGAPLLEVRTDARVGLRGVPGADLPPMCATREIFNVDCPGCGLTRSFVRLAEGDVTESLHYHRLGWLLMGLAAAQVPYRLGAMWDPKRWVMRKAARRRLGHVVIALLLGNWALGMFGV
jgi:hypothetical protein